MSYLGRCSRSSFPIISSFGGASSGIEKSRLSTFAGVWSGTPPSSVGTSPTDVEGASEFWVCGASDFLIISLPSESDSGASSSSTNRNSKSSSTKYLPTWCSSRTLAARPSFATWKYQWCVRHPPDLLKTEAQRFLIEQPRKYTTRCWQFHLFTGKLSNWSWMLT